LTIIPVVLQRAEVASFVAPPSPNRCITMQVGVDATRSPFIVATFLWACCLRHPIGVFTGTSRCPDWTVEWVFIPTGILWDAVVCSIDLLSVTLEIYIGDYLNFKN